MYLTLLCINLSYIFSFNCVFCAKFMGKCEKHNKKEKNASVALQKELMPPPPLKGPYGPFPLSVNKNSKRYHVVFTCKNCN